MKNGDLEIDAGYTGVTRPGRYGLPAKKTGAMGEVISVPDGIRQDLREKPNDIQKYADSFRVKPECAACLIKFNRETRHVFKSYLALKTEGIDFWSRKSLEKILEDARLTRDFSHELGGRFLLL